MSEFICVTDCYWGKPGGPRRVWKAGEVYEGDESPNKHFKPAGGNSGLRAFIEPVNMAEINVTNMRPEECQVFIKNRYGKDLDTSKPNYTQDALRIMRGNKAIRPPVPEPEKSRVLPEALTKLQYADKIQKENPGIEIPAITLRSMRALQEFEKGLKENKEDFMA